MTCFRQFRVIDPTLVLILVTGNVSSGSDHTFWPNERVIFPQIKSSIIRWHGTFILYQKQVSTSSCLIVCVLASCVDVGFIASLSPGLVLIKKTIFLDPASRVQVQLILDKRKAKIFFYLSP